MKPVRQAPAPSLEAVHEAIASLGRLAELYQTRRQQLAQSVGLTEREWEVLEEISTEHFMPSLFARRRDSTPAAVSKLLRQLLDKGLISVFLKKEDQRFRDYVLTSRGRRLLGRLAKHRKDAIERVWLGLDTAELRAFVGFSAKLIGRLEDYSELAEREE